MPKQDTADVREMARWALRKFMRECSEERTCTSWVHDNEYLLWRDVLEAPDTPLPLATTDESGWHAVAQRLRRLAQLAGGWYYRSDTTDRIMFIRLSAWRTRYATLWEPDHPRRSLAQRMEEDTARAEQLPEHWASRGSLLGVARDTDSQTSALDPAFEAEVDAVIERDVELLAMLKECD